MASKMVALRIPADKLAQIDQNARAAGLTRTAWMIQASISYQAPEDTDELDAIRHRLERLERMAGLD